MADVKIPKMLGSMSHTYQKAWYKKNKMELPAHLQRASSAGKVDTTRTKQAQQQSLKAYGATKGTRTGSAEGTGEEMRDTVKPLTRDQWSKVHAAKRASEGKPLTKDQRLSIIARTVRKAQAKHDVPTLDNNDAHADVRHDHDLMHAVGVRHSYNEGFDPSPAAIAKMLVDKHGPNVTKDHIKELEDERDSHGGLDHEEIMKHVKKMTEEVEQIDEISRDMDKVLRKPTSDELSADIAKFLEKGGAVTVHKPQRAKFRPGTALASKHDTTVARASGGKGVPRNQIGKNLGLARGGDLKKMLTMTKKEKLATEEVEVDESVATAQKVMDRANVVAKTNPDPKKRFAAGGLAHKAMLRTINPTGVNTGIVRGGGNKTYRMLTGKVPPYQLTPKTGYSEEVEQISEMDSEGYRGHRGDEDPGKGPAKYVKPVTAKKTQDDAAKVLAKSFEKNKIKKEEVVIEGAKEDAEKLLGGPVKTRTGNEPKGKLPLGFRQARNLARKAMKAGKSVTESTAEVTEVNEMSHGKALAKMIMAKQSKHPIAQHMGEEQDREYDYEGDMAKSQLKSVITNAQKLHDMLEDDTNLPEWVQLKITLAEDYIVTAANYMDGELDEEVSIDEPHMTDAQMKRREKLVKSMKSADWEKRYPGRGEKVMYATATKMAMKEEAEGLFEDHEDTYAKHMNAHINAANAGKWDKAEMHAQKAEAAAAKHFKATGKKIRDIGYTGDSPHIIGSGMKEEVEQVDEKYMGFKAVMAAAKKGGARDPAAVAAAIGRKKYGKEKFQAMAAAGKRHANEEVEQTDEIYEPYGTRKLRRDMKTAARMAAHDAAQPPFVEPEWLTKQRAASKERERAKQAAEKKKTNEEVVTEAEGSIPTTPKEKELAAHHGDPNRITFGDVLKARLKSAAAKKMGK